VANRRLLLRVAQGSLAPSLAVLVIASACAASAPGGDPLPRWTFDPAMVFPADRSLARPEDGIALADGRLIVADQAHGLRHVLPDGTSRPFGDLAGAGYVPAPSEHAGAANGVSLEPDGTHLLVADVLGGGIYRVELASGVTRRVYLHPFGVNTACRDSRGAIWFTQSTRNTAEQGEAGMFAAVDVPVADGALWRVPVRDGELAAHAELVRGGLSYPNGLVLDEQRGALYLAELARDRVLRFRLDVVGGRIDGETTLLEIACPDNLELDGHGRLWVALPLRNEVLVVDTGTGRSHSAFHLQSPAQTELSAEFTRRGASKTPRLELLTPALSEPLPGFVTGIILGPDGGTVHLTGLGDALVRLERPRL
jgi:sugar lactone lactonase YvrE